MRNGNIQNIITALKASGTNPPTPIAKLITDARTVTTAARESRRNHDPYTTLAAAWADSVLNSTDTTSDPETLKALHQHALHSRDLENTLELVFDQRIITELNNHQDRILAAFKTAADTAGATLTQAHTILGNTPLNQHAAIFKLGPAAAQAHVDATNAVHTIRTINAAWFALATLTGFANPNTPFNTRMAELTHTQHNNTRTTKDPWAIITNGATINLATNQATLTEREHNIERERLTHEAAQTEANRRPDYRPKTTQS